MSAYVFDHGSGTLESPYQVWTAADLEGARDHLTSHFIQMTNIDLSHISDWEPIGRHDWVYFTGSYDGQEYIINNLTITNDDGVWEYLFALFGGVDGAAIIQNIILKNVNINVTGAWHYYMGSLIGDYRGYSKVINCHAEGSVTGESGVGGLIGWTQRSGIKRCSFKGNVVGVDYVGGITGALSSSYIQQSFADANVLGVERTGGLVGNSAVVSTAMPSLVKNCYAKGKVEITGSGNEHIGGLIGYVDQSRVEKSYAAVEVDFVSGLSGGLCGTSTGTRVYIVDSYYDSDISNHSDFGKGYPRTTLEMTYDYDNFPNDVYTHWIFCDNGFPILNNKYPILKWMLPIWRHDKNHNANDGYPYFCWQIPPVVLVSTCIPFLFKVPYWE